MTAAVIAGLVVSGATVSAAGDPYTPGTTGYDVSYPQCSSNPPTGTFGIVGVNGGRPFTFNGCLTAEYSAAPSSSLYINTAYSGAYRKNITAGCSSAPATITGSANRQAWAIGCSEADTSLLQTSGLSTPLMWWLDVETGNSWSSSNQALNQFAIQGAVDRLAQTNLPVGVYSTASMWATITGAGFTPNTVLGDWVAGASCTTAKPFMPGTTVWLTQSTSGGVDSDQAC